MSRPDRMSGRILVVESDPGTRRVLVGILEDEGWSVESAKSLGEAREKTSAAPFDTIFAALTLPDGAGVDLAVERRLESDPVPVLLVVPETDVERELEAIRKGVDDVLEAPLSLPRVVLAAARAVELARLRRAVATRAEDAAVFPARGMSVEADLGFATLREAREEWEKAFLLRAIEAEGGSVARAALRLGVERSGLYRKLKAWGVS